MNPFLVQEVQPPLIYLRGDGRLNNNTQSQNSSTFYPSFTSLPCSFSLVLRSFFVLKGSDPRGSRGGRTDLGQPIADAGPSRARVVSGPEKHPPDCLRTALPDGSPST